MAEVTDDDPLPKPPSVVAALDELRECGVRAPMKLASAVDDWPSSIHPMPVALSSSSLTSKAPTGGWHEGWIVDAQ